MTKTEIAQPNFAQFASQMARNPHSLAQLQEAMKDAKRKKAIGDRISELRERRGFTQPQVAERMGMASKLRTYQKLGGRPRDQRGELRTAGQSARLLL